jgi:guanylate kinase
MALSKKEFGRLVVVSGHSGSGKTTLMRGLMDNEILSFTTRQKRDGEVEGKDYNMFDKKELAEWTEYSGNHYGATKKEVREKLELGDAYVIADVTGMLQFQRYYLDALTIFIQSSSRDEAVENMLGRGDSMESIQNRMKTYEEELENFYLYDYVVENTRGSFDDTLEGLKAILNENEIKTKEGV